MSKTISSGAERFDAIVVGARVAGAATAMLLARRGLRVLMVDRRRPGTDTLSTHALMRGGVTQLARWGLLDRVRRSGAPPVTRTIFHYGDTIEAVEIKPGGGIDALYAPRRYVLDSILVEAAEAAGVEARFGAAVQGLLMGGDRVIGVEGRAGSGGRFRATAPITIGADGMRSSVARRAGAVTERRGAGASAIIYGYWSGRIADGYEWFYRPGVSAGLIPTNGDETCVWVGAPGARFQDELRPDLEGSFHDLLERAAPEAAARLRAGATRQSPLYGFPGVAGYTRRPYGAGWALVGDASHFKDPLSAHGITSALRDAELLAEAVVAAGSGGSERAALAAYAAARDRLSARLDEVTDEIAAYRWDLAGIRELLLDLSRAMKGEIRAIEAFDNQPTKAAA